MPRTTALIVAPIALAAPAALGQHLDAIALEALEGPPSPPPLLHLQPRGDLDAVQINTDLAGLNITGDAANEPSIAVDPTAPNRIAIGWRQFDTTASNFRQAGYAYSRDGGRTWSGKRVFDAGIFRTDPVLVSDRAGTFHYLSLHTDLGALWRCDLFTSRDGGATWDGPAFAYGGDKSWIAIDNTGGPHDGNIYQAWNTAGNTYFPNQFSHSRDGGQTWSMPAILPNRPIFGTVDVGPDGTVRVAGIPSGRTQVSPFLWVDSASASFDAFTSVAIDPADLTRFTTRQPGASPNPGGLLSQVGIATNHAPGPRFGEVYVLSTVLAPLDVFDVDLAFFHSAGGSSFSEPIRVNDDPLGNLAWQWFGTMSVAPNGRIDVVWNDTRDSGNVRLSALYYAFSTDGGSTWSPNQALTPMWDSYLGWPMQNKIGDYYHMVSDDVGADLAFAATFNGEQDVYYLRIGDRDCNRNGVADADDLTTGALHDCDGDDVPDECEIAAGMEIDLDADGVPDGCQRACLADVDGNGATERMDVLIFLDGWFHAERRVDMNHDGRTDVFDLLDYLSLWFAGCP